jgi:hypothetical protein
MDGWINGGCQGGSHTHALPRVLHERNDDDATVHMSGPYIRRLTGYLGSYRLLVMGLMGYGLWVMGYGLWGKWGAAAAELSNCLIV